MNRTTRKIMDIVISIVGLIIIGIMILYAKEGRLSYQTLFEDFKEALQNKKDRVEERLNYNSVNYEDLITRLKAKGLVVGDAEKIPTNSLGARVAVKFNVEGKYINFYIFDFDKENEEIAKTKKSIEEKNKVFIDGKYYEVTINDCALIARYENNKKADIIVEEFKKIEPLSYDDMIKKREKKSSIKNITENAINAYEKTSSK